MHRKIAAPMIIVCVCLVSLAVMGQEAAKTGPEGAKTGAPAGAPPPPAAPAPGAAAAPAAAPPAQAPADGVKPAETGPKPAEGAAAPGAAGAEELKSVEEAYNIKLKGLEERVNELKEKVFRSKARLLLLQETVITGKVSSAKLALVHRNEMGSIFKLESAAYALDGAPIFNKVDQGGDLDKQEELEVLPTSSMVAGNHSISVYLVYRGSGFGIFSYLEGFRFKVKSSYTFYIEEGKITKVKVIAFEKGGFTTDIKDRPAVRFDVESAPDIDDKRPVGKGAPDDAQKK